AFEIFSGTGTKELVKSYNSSKMISTDEVNIISDSDYTKLSNREQERATWNDMDRMIKQFGREELTAPQYQAALKFYDDNPNGINKLTAAEKEAINEYEYYTSQPSYASSLQDLGVDSKLSGMELSEGDKSNVNTLRGLSEVSY
ncbi:hypothetical protein, partial [Oenococcus oeni]|uniref:hypothetical protein n=1 Tax=Oenococcus oeni TaxID=1247 RepID=UPI0015D66CB3